MAAEDSFHWYCREGKLKLVIQILNAKKAQAGKDGVAELLEKRDGLYSYTPLHEAASYGQDEVLSLLLAYGGDPNQCTSSGYTPLHLSASRGSAKCVRALLQHGADITALDRHTKSPLHTANLGNHREACRLLRSAEVMQAADQNSPNLGEILQRFKHGDVDEGTFDEGLLLCARKGFADSAGLFIDKGAIHYVSTFKEAIEHKHYEVATLLLLCACVSTGDVNGLRQLFNGTGEQSASATSEPTTLFRRRSRAMSALSSIHFSQKSDYASAFALALMEPHNSAISRVLRSGELRTVHVVKVALRTQQLDSALLVLLHTCCDKTHRRIDWSKLGLRKLAPGWLKAVAQWASRLDLSMNALSVMNEEVSTCKRLERLDLSRNSLQRLPAEVVQLPLLRSLLLQYNRLFELPECSWTNSLKVLDVSFNQLCMLPNGLHHTQLQSLNISVNNFTKVPHVVSNLLMLCSLNMSGNDKLLVLPNSLGRLRKLFELKVSTNHIMDPPPQYLTDAKRCVMFLRQRLLGSRPLYRMKLMVVGLAAQGKSSIIKRLQGKDLGENLATVGVDLSELHINCPIRARNRRPQFVFNVWDFGGQEEYYATHQCFLTRRSLYLVLWNITDGEEGIEKLRPWLDNLVARAPGSPILIIATHIDKLEEPVSDFIKKMMKKVTELMLLPRYKQLKFAYTTAVSCVTCEGISRLRDEIYNAAESYECPPGHKIMGELVPLSYVRLDDLIHEKRLELSHRKLPQILRRAELRQAMRRRNLVDIEEEEELQLASEHLHNVGTMLHYPDRASGLDDLFFIDPRWLCDMMSKVITIQERNPYIRKGILSCEMTPMLFRCDRFPPNLIPQYLALLNRFEIAVPLDDDTVLIPSMLHSDPPDDLPLLHPSSVTPTLALRRLYKMTGVPTGLWSRLMARLLQRLQKTVEAMGLVRGKWYDSRRQDSSSTNLSKPTSDCDRPKASVAYWRYGICLLHPRLAFIVHQVNAGLGGVSDSCGLEIAMSVGPNGRHMMVLIIDEISKLISEWYPGLETQDCSGFEPTMEVLVPCYRCVEGGLPFPFMFEFDVLADVAGRQPSISCPNHPEEPSLLKNLVPELLFLDLPADFLLSSNDVCFSQDEDSILGQGSFGSVYRAKIGDQEVAVKTFRENTPEGTRGAFATLRQEVDILKRTAHPCLVSMVAVVLQPLQLVLELASFGSLYSAVIKPKANVSRMLLNSMAAQVAMALAYLHNQEIVFRDLKSDNVLVFSMDVRDNVNVKLTDYGIAAVLSPSGMKGYQGTPGFQAPEILKFVGTEEYNSTVDIYSFGMFLYELMSGDRPFAELSQPQIIDAVLRGQRPDLSQLPVTKCGLLYWTNLMQMCWDEEPFCRPHAQQIARHLLDPNVMSLLGHCYVPTSRSVRRAAYIEHTNEIWLCCNDPRGSDVLIFNAKSMDLMRQFDIPDYQVQQIIVIDGVKVWIGLKQGLSPGMIYVYHASRQHLKLVSRMELHDSIYAMLHCPSMAAVWVSMCDASVDIIPTKPGRRTSLKRISVGDYPARSMVLAGGHVWCACFTAIHVFDCTTVTRQASWAASPVPQRQIDRMCLSMDKTIVWSSVYDDSTVCAWRVVDCKKHIEINTRQDVKRLLPEAGIDQAIITAMESSFDTLWLGLKSGYLLIYNQKTGDLLTSLMPYTEWVCVLVQCPSPGPCGSEMGMILSAGKGFRKCCPPMPDNLYNPYEESACPEETVLVSRAWCCGGVALLWEAHTSDSFLLMEKRRDDYVDNILQKNMANHLPQVNELSQSLEWNPQAWNEKWKTMCDDQETRALAWRDAIQMEQLSPQSRERLESLQLNQPSANDELPLALERDSAFEEDSACSGAEDKASFSCIHPTLRQVSASSELSTSFLSSHDSALSMRMSRTSSLQESWFCPGGPVSDAELCRIDESAASLQTVRHLPDSNKYNEEGDNAN